MASAKQAWINKNRLPHETDAEVNERYRQYMRSLAAKGGRKSTGYEFAHGRISPSEAAKMGVGKRKHFSKKDQI